MMAGKHGLEDKKPLWQRLGWLVLIWAMSVAALGMAAWRDEFQKRFNADFYTGSVIHIYTLLGEAMTKAKSTDPVKVAHALEDLTLESVVGPVRMRGEDHQLLLPQVVNTIAPVDGKAVKVGWEGTNYGFRTDAAYTGNELAQGTDCKMARP